MSPKLHDTDKALAMLKEANENPQSFGALCKHQFGLLFID